MDDGYHGRPFIQVRVGWADPWPDCDGCLNSRIKTAGAAGSGPTTPAYGRLQLRSVAVAHQFQDVDEEVDEVQVEVQGAEDGDLLDDLGSLVLIGREDELGLLGVVDGQPGEEDDADTGDHLQRRVRGGQEHQRHLDHDQEEQGDQEDGTHAHQVPPRGQSQHAQHEEEPCADHQGQQDGGQGVGDEYAAQGEAHQGGIKVEHDPGRRCPHLHDPGAQEDGKGHLDQGQADPANGPCGHDEGVQQSGGGCQIGHHRCDQQTDGHLPVGTGHGDPFRLLEGRGGVGVDRRRGHCLGLWHLHGRGLSISGLVVLALRCILSLGGVLGLLVLLPVRLLPILALLLVERVEVLVSLGLVFKCHSVLLGVLRLVIHQIILSLHG